MTDAGRGMRWAALARIAPVAATIFAAGIVLVGTAEVWAQGCAMCAASMPGADDPLSTGFGYTVYIFLGVTYGLFAVGGGSIAYLYWRAVAPRESSRILRFQAVGKEEQS